MLSRNKNTADITIMERRGGQVGERVSSVMDLSHLSHWSHSGDTYDNSDNIYVDI